MDLNDDCPICMDRKQPPIVRLECGHLFCRECIKSAYTVQQRQRRQRTCPVCRNPIVRISFANELGEPVEEEVREEEDDEDDDEPLIVEVVPPRPVIVEEAPRPVIVEPPRTPPPRARAIARIEDHYGRGRNIRYLVRWSDGSTSEESRAYMDTWPDVMAEYARRIRARNQREYMQRRSL